MILIVEVRNEYGQRGDHRGMRIEEGQACRVIVFEVADVRGVGQYIDVGVHGGQGVLHRSGMREHSQALAMRLIDDHRQVWDSGPPGVAIMKVLMASKPCCLTERTAARVSSSGMAGGAAVARPGGRAGSVRPRSV